MDKPTRTRVNDYIDKEIKEYQKIEEAAAKAEEERVSVLPEKKFQHIDSDFFSFSLSLRNRQHLQMQKLIM